MIVQDPRLDKHTKEKNVCLFLRRLWNKESPVSYILMIINMLGLSISSGVNSDAD